MRGLHFRFVIVRGALDPELISELQDAVSSVLYASWLITQWQEHVHWLLKRYPSIPPEKLAHPLSFGKDSNAYRSHELTAHCTSLYYVPCLCSGLYAGLMCLIPYIPACCDQYFCSGPFLVARRGRRKVPTDGGPSSVPLAP